MSKFINGTKDGNIEIDTLKLGEYAFGNSTDTSSVGFKTIVTNKIDVKVFPNPAKQKCTVEFNNEIEKDYRIKIISIEGKELFQIGVENKKTTIDLSHFAKGTYLIQIETEDRLMYTQKLLID